MTSSRRQGAAAAQRVVVIGAGLTGLTAASTLETAGFAVTVLDKARGAGGRMNTRRDGELRFDHGAPSFTVRDPAFAEAVARWQTQGVVLPWRPELAVISDGEVCSAQAGRERYVGVPGMNELCRHLAGELADCRFGWQVTEVQREVDGWLVCAVTGDPPTKVHVRGDTLLVTAPAPQSQALIGHHLEALATLDARMHSCWAVMAQYNQPLMTPYDAAWVTEGPLCWLASEASKPQRPAGYAWTLLASPAWAEHQLELAASEASDALLEAAAALPGVNDAKVLRATAHRWRFAQVNPTFRCGPFHQPADRLVVTGDWCLGGGVEAAYLAGVDAAARLADRHRR